MCVSQKTEAGFCFGTLQKPQQKRTLKGCRGSPLDININPLTEYTHTHTTCMLLAQLSLSKHFKYLGVMGILCSEEQQQKRTEENFSCEPVVWKNVKS